MKALRQKLVGDKLVVEYDDHGYKHVESYPLVDGKPNPLLRHTHSRSFNSVCKGLQSEVKTTGTCYRCGSKYGQWSMSRQGFLCSSCWDIEVAECV